MDFDYPFRTLLFFGIILVAFWIAWKLGVKGLKKWGIWIAVMISLLSSAVILVPAGYYWYVTEPDLLGKGLALFVYRISFFIINAITILRLVLLKRTFNGKR